jgi:hypothetical protein
MRIQQILLVGDKQPGRVEENRRRSEFRDRAIQGSQVMESCHTLEKQHWPADLPQ